MYGSTKHFGLSLLALSTLVLGVAQAQSSIPSGPGTGMALTRMSHEATHILDDVSMAQNALQQGNKTAAESEISQALMARNHLAMTARSHNLPKVVPIFSEIEQSTALGAVVAQKNNGQPMPPMKEPVAVDGVTGQFTFVGLDLDKTEVKLLAAQQAIKANNIQAAEQSLGNVGDELVVAKIDTDTPLLAIRENLGIAQQALHAKHEKEATAALQQAGVELAAYAQQSGPHQQDATTLKTSIDHMLSMEGQKSAAAAGQVQGWWAQVNSWMQPPSA